MIFFVIVLQFTIPCQLSDVAAPSRREDPGLRGSSLQTAFPIEDPPLPAALSVYPQIFHDAITWDELGAFVVTGDIPDMWIRDSVASVLPFCDTYENLCYGVLKRTSYYLHESPYANSFRKTPHRAHTATERRLKRDGYVATYNYELDSGLWWILLWKTLGSPYEFLHTMRLLLRIYLGSFGPPSDYSYPEVTANMRKVNTSSGLVWSAFRPSDDPMTYGFHIPSQFFLLSVFDEVAEARALCDSVREGLRVHAVQNGRYCYEVDGFGSCLFMDDANIPSLLALPFYAKSKYDRDTYERTRKWILSASNPTYSHGKYAVGVGSPHTPKGYIWPMAMITAATTFTQLAAVHDLIWTWPRGFVESFDPNRPSLFTRGWFLWPNAWYTERAKELQPRLSVSLVRGNSTIWRMCMTYTTVMSSERVLILTTYILRMLNQYLGATLIPLSTPKRVVSPLGTVRRSII